MPSTEGEPSSTGSSACSDHPACAGLVGHCCPTDASFMLGCCSSPSPPRPPSPLPLPPPPLPPPLRLCEWRCDDSLVAGTGLQPSPPPPLTGCACSTLATGCLSGDQSVLDRCGCAEWQDERAPFCYVVAPDACPSSIPSSQYLMRASYRDCDPAHEEPARIPAPPPAAPPPAHPDSLPSPAPALPRPSGDCRYVCSETPSTAPPLRPPSLPPVSPSLPPNPPPPPHLPTPAMTPLGPNNATSSQLVVLGSGVVSWWSVSVMLPVSLLLVCVLFITCYTMSRRSHRGRSALRESTTLPRKITARATPLKRADLSTDDVSALGEPLPDGRAESSTASLVSGGRLFGSAVDAPPAVLTSDSPQSHRSSTSSRSPACSRSPHERFSPRGSLGLVVVVDRQARCAARRESARAAEREQSEGVAMLSLDRFAIP